MSASVSWPTPSFPSPRSRTLGRLLAAALCVFGICAKASAADGGAALRVVVPALPAQFDPHKALTTVDRAVASELFLGLTARDAFGTLIPGAANWQVSADGLNYAFTLSEGLAWSDGTPLVAADFVAGLTRARDPATAAPFAGDLAAIVNVAAPNPRTLTITLNRPSAAFLEVLSSPVAAPVPRHRIGNEGNAWARPESIVTNGPFIVTAQAGATLVRNPSFAAQSNIERIDFREGGAVDDAAGLIRDGEADLTVGYDFENPTGRVSSPFRADTGQNLYFIVVNTSHALLKVREVRHALAMSIDRGGLMRALRASDLVPAYAMVPSTAYAGGFQGPAPYASLQPEMRAAIAEVLLSELKIDAAHPVTFDFMYPKGAFHVAVAKNIAEKWIKLGVRVRLQEKAPADYARSLREGEFDMAVATWPGIDETPRSYLAPLRFMPDPRNFPRYTEADFERRMADADSEVDSTRRLTMHSDAEKVLIEDQPILPVFFFTPLRPVAAGLKGWQPNRNGIHPLHLMSR